jgi:hypothetical protein
MNTPGYSLGYSAFSMKLMVFLRGK